MPLRRRPFAAHVRLACLTALLALALGCGEVGTVALAPQLVLHGEAIDFGEVPVLTTAEATIRLDNLGGGPLSIFETRVDPADAPVAILEAPSSIASGEHASIVLAYTPPALGTLDATLRLTTDDPDRPSVSLALQGHSSTQGRAEVIASLDFAGVCEGGERLGRIDIRSTGTAPLSLTGVELVQTGDGADFSFVGSTRTPVAIPPGESISLPLRYRPTFGAPSPAAATLVLTTSDPEQPRVELALNASINRAPIAHIAPFPALAPGSILSLDGTGSTDPEGQTPLTHAWTLERAPDDSRAAIEDATAAQTALTIDAAGAYDLALTVTDAAGCASQTARATALAQTAEALRFELFWDNLDSDLDLHLTPEGGDFFGPLDCHFAEGQLSPDWGVLGEASDDPTLVRDALSGYGPEIVSLPDPSAGTYRALVHYFSAHHERDPATTATLRLYRFGVLVREARRALSLEDARWEVLSVTWPGGDFSLIDLCEGCE